MKKISLLAMAIFGLMFTAAAEEEWDVFAISFTDEVPVNAATTTIYGVKVGVPITAGPAPVYGVDCAVGWAGTQKVSGFQGSLGVADCKELSGLQLSLVNFGVKIAGVQLGVVNISEETAFQIGILNIIKKSPVVALPVINCRF